MSFNSICCRNMICITLTQYTIRVGPEGDNYFQGQISSIGFFFHVTFVIIPNVLVTILSQGFINLV